MTVQFSCRGERPFARKRSWLKFLPFTRKMGHEENCQSLFSLSSSRERSERLRCALSWFFTATSGVSFLSVQRLLAREAELACAADWHVFLQHCDRRRSSAHCVLCSTEESLLISEDGEPLTVDLIRPPAEGSLASNMFFAVISSADASPGMASWDALPRITPKFLTRTCISPRTKT